MAITAGTPTSGTAAGSATITVTLPSGSATGDIIILAFANQGTSGPTKPSDWNVALATVSAGSGQSVTTWWAAWNAGLTTSITNASSVVSWTCNKYTGCAASPLDGTPVAAHNTSANTTLPTGAPTTGPAGDYEVLIYGFTVGTSITAVASGSSIDQTQANGVSICCCLGHNNTTSLGASTTCTAFSQTESSAGSTRKTGIGLLLLVGGATSVNAPGIDSTEDFGVATPLITADAFGNGISSAEDFGPITATIFVNAPGIDSTEDFGAAAVVRSVSAPGIDSLEDFGGVTMAFTVNAPGIDSAEDFGAITATIFVVAPGIDTAEDFGAATVTFSTSAPGIDSTEDFGPITATIFVNAAGIESTEDFGTATVTQGASGVAAPGIDSTEDFGAILMAIGVAINGIDSAEEFGVATVSQPQPPSTAAYASWPLDDEGLFYIAGGWGQKAGIR